jgi:protein O-GlcNAc transferase
MLQVAPEQALEMARWCEEQGRWADAARWHVAAGMPAAAMQEKAVAAQRAGNLAAAAEWFSGVAEKMPQDATARMNMGAALLEAGQVQRAIESLQEAIKLSPNYGDAHYNLGKALKTHGDLEEAVKAYQEAIRVGPVRALMHNGLGDAYVALGKQAEAEECFRQAVACDPGYAPGHNNLGTVLLGRGDMAGAIAAYRKALAIAPHFAGAMSNLAYALSQSGGEAVAAYREAVRLAPQEASLHSNLLYAMHLDPAFDAKEIGDECRRWARRHADPLLAQSRPHENERTADRRLRVGYVSPDFNSHAVGRLILPLLRAHNRAAVEICCYSGGQWVDIITQRLRAQTDLWREAEFMTDETVAEMVRHDRIDVLVDLTVHTRSNRLLTFARKPAPVQVTYLAYCSTTGMQAMDYRLSDPYMDPVGMDESVYAEKTVRLPESYWCYENPVEVLGGGDLPARKAGHVTFASLNNFAKVSAAALEAWAEILRQVPGSRLVMYAHSGSHRERVLSKLEALGVDGGRCEFVGHVPFQEYLCRYVSIDMLLDTFPWAGGTTTCDALWMGVPAVTLRGRTAVGRGGASILTNVGLPELVADSVPDYVRIAVELARDWERLADLRKTLRDRMRASPLMNEQLFAQQVEAAYREMWRPWCTHANA